MNSIPQTDKVVDVAYPFFDLKSDFKLQDNIAIAAISSINRIEI